MKEDILKDLFEQQCDEESGDFLDDSYLVRYDSLVAASKSTKEEVKPHVLGLRNEGLIELRMAWNEEDGYFSGSGWMLTDKGVEKCKQLFIKKMLNKDQN